MYAYVPRRLAYTGVTLVGLSLVIFVLLRMVPGDIVSQMVDLQAQADPRQLEELRRFFGLDQPWHVQYISWLAGVVTGNLGQSWRLGGPVLNHILDGMSVTLELAFLATLFAAVVGIPFGVWAAVRQNRLEDGVLRIASLAGLSVPVFWQGSMLILLFSLYLRWTPPMRWISPLDDLANNLVLMALPVVTLGTASAAVVVRMTRNALLEVLRQDYIRTAHSKGLAGRAVLLSHALRNALIPVITVTGLQMGYLLGGAVVVEEVFTLPGVGRMLLQGLTQRDYPLVQGAVLFVAILFMLINLVTDLVYALLDPRIRYS
ncbi:MAG: ABC transporter permease [Dehalococcoidales bacterium]|nr:ABC transporter permease [Dehalococcoidales bacterium]